MEKETPKVTIVLPTYNGQKFIRESIESVLAQSMEDFELIIVDDCSNDDTNAIAAEYAQRDGRVRVIRNEINRKLPASLNRGFEEAKGEYLTWTSDDNLYEKNALEEMCRVLNAEPEVGLVYCDYNEIDENGQIICEIRTSDVNKLCYVNCVGACFMYRSSVAAQIGKYDENMFLSEDYDYWIRIYKASNIKHLPMLLYRYRVHGKSLTATRQELIHNQTAKLWMKHINFLVKKVETEEDLYFLCDAILKNAREEDKKLYYKEICRNSRKYQWKTFKRKVRRVLGKA